MASDLLSSMSSPEEKPSLVSLPDDLLFSCIARISRLHYRTLSLVSKRFRPLLVSPELYKVRSLLGNTESCLYVCLEFHQRPDYQWFTICRKPDRSVNNDTKSSGYVLATLPVPHPPHHPPVRLVTVGYNIYNIARCNYRASSTFSILDCRSHTWREGPTSRVKQSSVSTGFVDQKIYAVGVKKDGYSLEVLDTNKQACDPVPIPFSEPARRFYYGKSDGKFQVVAESDEKVVSYNSKECRWDPGGRDEVSSDKFLRTYCEIENVSYCGYQGVLRWYDTKVRMWRNVMGVVGLPNFSLNAVVHLANRGGKMAVLWVEYSTFRSSEECKSKVWCVEIALERRESGEIWGEIEWFDNVLTVSEPCFLRKVLGPTV